MSIRWSTVAAACAACVFAACVVAAPARAQDTGAQMQALIGKVSPSIAEVRAVVRMEMRGGGESNSQESRVTLQGAVVTETGLLMVSNTPFSPKRILELMGGGELPAGMDMRATPTSFKVTLPGDDKEYDAFLGATDPVLDLAFVQIEGLGDRKLPSIDFSASSDPAVGDQIVLVSRLPKGYDYAPFFQTSRVSGEIAKPRRAWVLDGGISQFGLPVFTTQGAVCGVLTTVVSGAQDDGAGDAMGFTMLMRLMGGGGGTPGGVFVVPGSAVKAVIDRAVLRTAEVAAERAKRRAEQPAEAEKPRPSTGARPAAPGQPRPSTGTGPRPAAPGSPRPR
ncbi:MAG TPA: serine protease [Chthonomonadales bacterium]|nr:serine protease [Chthonomonadales bacterium]